jgi:hypothetical protein
MMYLLQGGIGNATLVYNGYESRLITYPIRHLLFTFKVRIKIGPFLWVA